MPKGIYIRTEQNKVNIGLAKKGKIPWNKGLKGSQKHSEETKKRMSVSAKGKIKSIEHRKKLSESKTGDKNPMKKKENALKVRKALFGRKNPEQSKRMKGNIPWNKGIANLKFRGKNNPNWKGGITPLMSIVRSITSYIEWRDKIFKRDDYTCQECKKRGCYLEAHHIKQFNIIIKENNIKTLEEALSCQELWNINNGVTLCKDCHNLTKVKQ